MGKKIHGREFIEFRQGLIRAKHKTRRYESGAAKRKKLNAAKAEIEKSTRLDSFFRAVPASESSSLDTCASTQIKLKDDYVKEFQSCQSWRRTAVPFTIAEQAA